MEENLGEKKSKGMNRRTALKLLTGGGIAALAAYYGLSHKEISTFLDEDSFWKISRMMRIV